jgi:hypothetical protein
LFSLIKLILIIVVIVFVFLRLTFSKIKQNLGELMRKLAKMSLVAAVAVAGMTTVASAKPLSEAVKGMDIKGSVEYRFENRTTNKVHTSGENAKVNLVLSAPVNDSVTFVTQGLLNTQANASADATTSTAYAPVNVMEAKFVVKSGATTAVVGTQALATPWTDAAEGARAAGALVTHNLGDVTLAGAYFRNSKMGIDANAELTNSNLTALAAIGKVDMVSYQAWFLDIGANTGGAVSKGGSATALLVSANLDAAKIDASYASLKGKSGSLKSQTLTKAIVTVPTDAVTIVAGAAKGGKDGDLVTFDSDAKVGFESWMIRAGQGNQLDLSAMTLAAVAPVGPVSLKLQYTTAEFDQAATATVAKTKVEASEILLQVDYKMSKNFITYFEYAQVDQDSTPTGGSKAKTEIDRARLSVEYTF